MQDEEEAVIEFTTAGCKTMADDTLRLQIDVEPRQADHAFQLFGRRGLHGAIVRLNVDLTAEEPKKGHHGQFWQKLIASGIFNAPPVLEAIGTEKEFELWIRGQTSAIDGNHDWDEERGEPVCDPAHVRRTAEGSGTAQKPPYYAVPLTHKQHLVQHQDGENALVQFFGTPPPGIGAWLEKKAEQYRAEWASKTLAETLAPGVKSRSEVHPDLVRCWLDENELLIYLPKGMR